MIRAFSPFLALRYLITRRINILGVLGVAFAVWAMLVVDGVFTGFVRDIRNNVESSAPPLLLTDLPHDSSFTIFHDALSGDPDVIALAPRLRQHAMLQPIRQDQRKRAKRGSNQLDFDHTKNGFAMLIGIDPLLETKVVSMSAWLLRGSNEIARYGRDESPSRVFDEPDEERLAEMLLPDRVEWDMRRRAGMPHDPDVNNHRSSLPGMLMGWRRVFNLPHIQDGDPFEVVCASFPGEDGAATDEEEPLAYDELLELDATVAAKGLGAQALAKLSSETLVAESEEVVGGDSCCICMCEYMAVENIFRLTCSHVGHEGCMSTYFESSTRCPHCRVEVPE